MDLQRDDAASRHALRYEALCATLREHGALGVAFSGGADSTLLLAAARDSLGSERVLALTAVTPYMVRQEIGEAIEMASQLGVRHELVEMPMPDGLQSNPQDRCYRCKHAMYRLLLAHAAGLGLDCVVDGSNLDDVDDFRPGLKALRELSVPTPFIAHGIDKSAVRDLARMLALPTWRKPTNACLLTRLRFDERVSMERLQQIEEAERLLAAEGFSSVRVRCHDDLARIEVEPAQFGKLLEEAQRILEEVRELGFRHVTMDLAGYQHGSMNEPRA
ncbi:MAG: ATP-dependent sacrificial sulfur transferase LarE [Thiohalocapsa sp.]|nr:ATP-dependent sacrificial sulfur transferase LarE [Thiohalocapsa sp.]MCF7989656.1 ATP-dependent sacrificial sulfur transferase LarE [Thiohalocapsa sp.]